VLFDKKTNIKSNVNGKQGKAKLNPVIMDYIKSVVFLLINFETKVYPDKNIKGCEILLLIVLHLHMVTAENPLLFMAELNRVEDLLVLIHDI